MPATARPVLEGASFGDTSGVQPYFVKGFDAPTGPNDFAAIQQCREADGVPPKNTPHPNMPWLKVVDVQFSRFAKNFGAYVNAIYGVNTEQGTGGGPSGQWEIDTSIVPIQTHYDVGGSPIQVVYAAAIQQAAEREGAPSVQEMHQGAEVQQYLAMTIARLTRLEDTNPYLTSKNYVGKLNDRDFGETGDKEAWLCTRIAGTRPLTETKWTTTYEFQSVEDGWHVIAAYIDPTTGKPVALNVEPIALAADRPRVRLTADTKNQSQYNGYTIIRVQGSADYSQLNLPPLDAE